MKNFYEKFQEMPRARGCPPFAQQAPVKNEGTGQGWTMFHDYKFDQLGGQFWCVWFPAGVPLIACIVTCRMMLLKK